MSAVPLLLLDVGNSSVKWQLRQGENRIAGRSSLSEIIVDIESRLRRGLRDVLILVSSVASDDAEQLLQGEFKARGASAWFAVSRAELGGLKNSYAEPERMGVDRWLAMLGVRSNCEDRVCVIDAGSALTIDFLDAGGAHEGGFIIPGTGLMERALLLDTDRVRFERGPSSSLAPGKSTLEAVNHGLLLAQCGAIELAVRNALRTGPLLKAYFTGGDAARLLDVLRLPEPVKAAYCADLVFDGLVRQAQLENVI